jgi:DNA ligase-1
MTPTTPTPTATFAALAATLEQVANTSSRTRKTTAVADWFRSLEDLDLIRAVRFLSGEPVAGTGDRKMSVGHSILREAIVAVSGYSIDLFRICHREVGDTGETACHLLFGKTTPQTFTLADAEHFYLKLFQARRTADKVALLTDALRRLAPIEAKYFLKVITGSFRIGLQAKLVEEALARATGAKLTAVRAASNRSGDLAQIAAAAKHGTLDAIEARLFHPMEFMLARPLDAVEDLPEPTTWYVEDKYDGIRSQLHFESGKVRIFTRGLDDTTAAFPEIAAAFEQIAGTAIIDGELLAWRDQRALNFTMLQQRLARKKVTAALQQEIPVVFIGYDLLYRNGELLLDAPIEQRRAALEALFQNLPENLRLSPQAKLASAEQIETLFTAARERGNEGLLLKRQGSLYESGKRSAHWFKVKRPYGTLDVVVTAAEQGSGRRATMLSDYTFAVRDGDRFLNVGKAYSGLTDDEIRELTKVFRSTAKERFGRVTLVEPTVVLEVAFDGIQRSPRHKSGFALRFPRILRWRRDKTIAEADTISRVQDLYESTLR